MNKNTITLLEPKKYHATKRLFVGARGRVIPAVRANPTKISYQTALAQVRSFRVQSPAPTK
jgi:hypothetical protein